MVTLVLGVDNLVVVVEHGELNGGGAHVDAQVQVAAGSLGVEDRAFGAWAAATGSAAVAGSLTTDVSPATFLASATASATFSAAAVAAFCAASTTAGAASPRGSDHTVLYALDEFAHCLLLVVGLDGCGGVGRVLELQVQ